MQTSWLLMFSLRVIVVYYLFVEDTLYMGLKLNSLHFGVFAVFISLPIIQSAGTQYF